MATWGGSTPCQLDEDGYPSELGAEEEEEEEEEDEEEDGAESSSSDDLHCYSTRKQRSYSNRKTLGRSVKEAYKETHCFSITHKYTGHNSVNLKVYLISNFRNPLGIKKL